MTKEVRERFERIEAYLEEAGRMMAQTAAITAETARLGKETRKLLNEYIRSMTGRKNGNARWEKKRK